MIKVNKYLSWIKNRLLEAELEIKILSVILDYSN